MVGGLDFEHLVTIRGIAVGLIALVLLLWYIVQHIGEIEASNGRPLVINVVIGRIRRRQGGGRQ